MTCDLAQGCLRRRPWEYGRYGLPSAYQPVVDAVRARLSEELGPSVPRASALSAAELRLLPTLASHLSFPEIAAELFLSRHTVKSEAVSIYRKLGVSSRAQAVGRARELGLLSTGRPFIQSRGWNSPRHEVE